MLLPHVQECSNGDNISDWLDIASWVLNYRNLQPIHPRIWDGSHSATSLFSIKGTRLIDIKNLILSLSRINIFLKCNPVEEKTAPTGYNGVTE